MFRTIIIVSILGSVANAKTITLQIPDEEIAIVENDVVDAEQWLKDAWTGKVNRCKERMIKSYVDQRLKEGKAVPAGETVIIEQALSDPSRKNRKQRDTESPR